MIVSVIVCTYGRPKTLSALLSCLLQQTYRDIEILVVDGNPAGSPARAAVEETVAQLNATHCMQIIHSRRGLTRQRNTGLRVARGELIAFLDDDVTIGPEFFATTVNLFQLPELREVGGITGYDELTYGARIAPRWRIRKILGAIPSLEPGDIDRLGRAVPVNFIKPFSGFKQVGWLAGFCMIYRRTAVQGLEFDECLPTYGGEDRDFSIRVGAKWRLLLCGDLRLKHHGSAESRDPEIDRMVQNAFGVGRRFAKAAHGLSDHIILVKTIVGDLTVDLLSFLSRPSRIRFLTPAARIRGLIQGIRSVQSNVPAGWERNQVVANE